MEDVDSVPCPLCGAQMTTRQRLGLSLLQCQGCQSLLLQRQDLGLLIEQENDWHVHSGPSTQPLPRITADMVAPASKVPARDARSFVDALFG